MVTLVMNPNPLFNIFELFKFFFVCVFEWIFYPWMISNAYMLLIIYSRVGITQIYIYSILFLFVDCWGSNLSIQAGVGKLNGDLHQPSGISYESRSFSVRYLVSLAYRKLLIYGVKLSVVVHLRIEETESPTWASTTSILHLSIASSQEKGKLGKNTKVRQGTKGCRLKHKFRQQWTIVSLLSNLSYAFNVPRSSLYIAFQRGNERSNPSDLKA